VLQQISQITVPLSNFYVPMVFFVTILFDFSSYWSYFVQFWILGFYFCHKVSVFYNFFLYIAVFLLFFRFQFHSKRFCFVSLAAAIFFTEKCFTVSCTWCVRQVVSDLVIGHRISLRSSLISFILSHLLYGMSKSTDTLVVCFSQDSHTF